MSYIKPSEYKTIVEQFAVGYQLIRDSIHKADDSGAVVNMQAALDAVIAGDDSFAVSTTVDPKGSIMSDLGSTMFTANSTNFTTDKAKAAAAALFTASLTKLNRHVIQRTGIANIATYYSTYAMVSGNEPMSLFGDNPLAPDYFSADFAELSLKVGVTINPTYVDV